jgi:hypothetical protein
MDAAIVFTGITPSHFDAICAKAEAETGLQISGFQGTAQRSTPLGDVEIMWTYTPETAILTVQCLKHPFGAGHTVTNELHKLVEGA